MNEGNKKLYFDVDASTLKIKEILQKDYLELSMKAISDARPNRNGSWFTKESLEQCKDTFKNKPILGFFKQNDFVSHNGRWAKDKELNLDYWDTLGEGERILGFIRESDDVQIIEDENGLHWITLSCALWTQYCYKQVKRLLKDAIRAQKKGGPTKNISVEVNVLDSENVIGEDGKKILKINAFELVGITILGSRNSVPVEPGIEGAELSVLDMVGREAYDQQLTKVRLAYERLDQAKNIEGKKETIQMDKEKDENVTPEVTSKENPEVEKTPVVEDHEQDKKDFENEDDKKTEEDNKDSQVEDTKDQTDPKSEEGEPKEEPEKRPEENPEDKPEEKKENFDHDENEDDEDKDEKLNPIFDLTYMVERSAIDVERYQDCIRYYEQEGVVGGDKVIAMLKRHTAVYASMVKECAHMAAEIADEAYDEKKFTQDEKNQEATVTGYFEKDEDGSALMHAYQEYDSVAYDKIQLENEMKTLKEKFEASENKVKEYETNILLEKAKEFAIKGDLSDEQSKQIFEDCKSGKYNDEQALKQAVALMSFDSKQDSPKEKATYEAAITKAETKVSADDAEKSEKLSCWDKISNYCDK